jgi:hypothetical protein
MSTKKRVLVGIGAVVALWAVVTVYSLSSYLIRHRHDPLQQNAAEWGRNHHLGFVVDHLEVWLHSTPPSHKAAGQLSLDHVSDSVAPTTSVRPAAGATSGPTGSSAGAPAPLAAPSALTPVIQPALAGEGQWQVLTSVAATPVIWATSIRPLANYGSVVATAAVFDPDRVRAALFNGPLIPGGGPWVNGQRVTKAALPALLATFNGGFRFEHYKGGYVTEGKTVRALQNDEATLAIDNTGRLRLGVWGRDMTASSASWVSVRQNLPPVVFQGKVSINEFPGTYWGDNFHSVTFTYRSAMCSLADGRLMYVTVGNVDINLLGQSLVAMGCRTGMELDINGNWPQFDTYGGFGTPVRTPSLLDRRMSNASRYLNGSEKDFIALFDPATLPPGVVR